MYLDQFSDRRLGWGNKTEVGFSLLPPVWKCCNSLTARVDWSFHHVSGEYQFCLRYSVSFTNFGNEDKETVPKIISVIRSSIVIRTHVSTPRLWLFLLPLSSSSASSTWIVLTLFYIGDWPPKLHCLSVQVVKHQDYHSAVNSPSQIPPVLAYSSSKSQG